MTKTPLASLLLWPILFVSSAKGQAPPAVTLSSDYHPFTLPDIQGSLHYSVSLSERVTLGYNGTGTDSSATALDGELGYLSQSMTHPFSMIYSGGFLGGTSGQPSGVFQTLALSQVLTFRRSRLILSNAVSYLPQTAATGLSGIPGVGDAGLDPVQVGSDSGLGILTQQSNRINNAAAASFEQPITGKTTFQSTLSDTLLRYTGGSAANSSGQGQGSGIDSTQNAIDAGFNHRIDERTAYGCNYSVAKSTFSGSDLSFLTQSIEVSFSRHLTRKLALIANLGPQRTSGSAVTEPSISLAANIAATYTDKFSGLNLGYTSGTNSGYGVTTGSYSQSIQASAHRSLSPSLSVSLDGRYTRSTSLSNSTGNGFNTNSTAADIQINRALRQNLSLFVSYSTQDQTLQGAGLSSNSFSGFSQIISAGLTYTPQSIRLARR